MTAELREFLEQFNRFSPVDQQMLVKEILRRVKSLDAATPDDQLAAEIARQELDRR